MTLTTQLYFGDGHVPLASLLGTENRGFYQVLKFLR